MERDAVLIIDDDPDFREIARIIIEDQGLVVFDAEDCRAGLSILDREHDRLRLILVDYWMPGMPPPECLACLQERAGVDIRVVLVTAAMNPAARAAEVGVTRWLSKPFEFAQLSRLVRGSE